MISLVIGTPDSGKSAIAEDLAMQMQGPRYYIATMQVCDEESRARKIRHVKNREGKGFITLELPFDIGGATSCIQDQDPTLLLECVANLVGNELHDNPGRTVPGINDPVAQTAFVRELLSEISALADHAEHLIVVTNEFTADASYDDDTLLYLRLLNSLNEELIRIADRVYDLRNDRNR